MAFAIFQASGVIREGTVWQLKYIPDVIRSSRSNPENKIGAPSIYFNVL